MDSSSSFQEKGMKRGPAKGRDAGLNCDLVLCDSKKIFIGSVRLMRGAVKGMGGVAKKHGRGGGKR